MQSRFEESARRKARAGFAKSCFAWLVVLAAFVAGGLFAARCFGVEVPGGEALADVGRLVRMLGLTDSERTRIESFAEVIASFDVPEIRPWKSAPPEMRPKNAPAELAYRMLVEKTGGVCGIYEMTANGKGGVSIRELNPVGKPTAVSLSAFNKAKAGGVYLISCGGGVYVCGSDSPETGRAFLRRWTSRK